MSDISLPSNNRQVRDAEIKREAEAYRYDESVGLPLLAEERPRDANYPDYKVKLISQLIRIRYNLQAICEQSGLKFQKPKPVGELKKFLDTLSTGGNPLDYFAPDLGFITPKESNRPTSIDDYVNKVFVDRTAENKGNAALPEMATKWDSDKTFAYNFVAGPNPTQLVRYTDASRPADFDLNGLNLSAVPGFQGDEIKRAIGEGRVYFVDHSSLQQLFSDLPGAPARNATPRQFDQVSSGDWKYIYAPYAAFAVPPGEKALLPIAIQCGPRYEGHQIYTPNDGYSWKMARVCVLAAHNNHHEVVSHLGLTHLLIDPILMATRRNLHPSHPVYVLLNPHFEGTAGINISARTSLILPERSVDRLVGSKIEANYPFLKKERLDYSFRKNFPKERFKRLQVDDAGRLPAYPYREDAIRIWDAISAWISEYVSIWYGRDADVQADHEIQNWAREIQEQGQVKDFCVGNQAGINSRDELIEVLTMTVFTAGPQHAAVNFPQGNEMLFVPANPLAGYAQAPQGTGHSLQDFLNILPPLDVAVQSWGILTLLAGINTTRLGDYRGAFSRNKGSSQQVDASEDGRQRFVQALARVEAEITEANKVRRSIFDLEYVHLLPSRIPASINI